MAAPSSARLKGDDYQHLISWYYILSLLRPSYHVDKVKLEDSSAGLVDDVTVYRGGNDPKVDFYQIKFHVDQRESYSIDSLLKATKGKSIMEKFWNTWKKIRHDYPDRKISLNLYSNWLIDPSDEILKCISGENGCLEAIFLSSDADSAIGKKRKQWMDAHGASEAEFAEFSRCLVFHLGKDFSEELKRIISERMLLFNLKNDENALYVGAGVVRDWIKSKVEDITITVLEGKLQELSLYQPPNEKAVAVYFTTIKDRRFDLSPDYVLDWRRYFNSAGGRGDHELINAKDWNETLLPELLQLEEKINTESGAGLIRARGYSRLSAWFAIGHTFSEVGGYKIEVNQVDQLWRSDFKSPSEFDIVEETESDSPSIKSGVVAVGISITGSLKEDVKKYLASNTPADSILFLTPKHGVGKDAIKSNGDIVTLAKLAKEKIRSFVKANDAKKLLLFYFGPLSGACFIGHQLNATCKEIQIMENTSNGSYVPSFLLLN